MAERLKTKAIQDSNGSYRSGGIVGGKGLHIIPYQNAIDSRNTRVVNNALTVRDGFYTVSEDPEGIGAKKVQGITSNGSLFIAVDQKFYSVDLSDGSLTEISSVGNRFNADTQVNFVNYSRFVIALTGDDFPWVYDRVADTRTKLTATEIETGSLPRFGAKFLYGTYIAGGGDNKDLLYISRGATRDNPEYSYDWVGTGSEIKQMQSNIESLVSNRERLYIFTEDSIEIITANSLTSVGSVSATYSVPIAGKNRVACHRSVVVADNIIFFLTNKNQIKTISYAPGITEADIGNISNRKGRTIQKFLDTLDEDQSQSFGYFHKEKMLVKRHLRQAGMPINNIVLVYDIDNDNFYIDDNKFFSCRTEHNGEYYTGSDATPLVYIDEKGSDDDGQDISWYRNGAYWSPGLPTVRTEYREVGITGQIGINTTINIDVIVDGETEKMSQIIGSDIEAVALGSEPIGQDTIAGEYVELGIEKFEKVISPGNLRARGNIIQVNVSGQGVAQDFAISQLTIGYIPLGDTDKADKL